MTSEHLHPEGQSLVSVAGFTQSWKEKAGGKPVAVTRDETKLNVDEERMEGRTRRLKNAMKRLVRMFILPISCV